MRPRKLRIEGFTCFREPVEIDFSGLDLFVISGPTGSGKTTIIDAMCYALYGEVSRQTKVADLIARGALTMRVQFEFEGGGERLRVHRGVNVTRSTNKKTGGEKVTRDISPVQFEVYRNGEWEPRAIRRPIAEGRRAAAAPAGAPAFMIRLGRLPGDPPVAPAACPVGVPSLLAKPGRHREARPVAR